MSSIMEVEESTPGEKIAVHPLALVHMSDHYTRVTTGGSPLSKQAPVVGILYGGTGGDTIVDAEDIPLDDPTKAVELHQAVFPNNVVVGCYRVTATESDPTASDIQQLQALRQQQGALCAYFGLLQVNPPPADNAKSDDKALPLQLFVLPSDGSNVLVAVEDWHLYTAAAAERIAVERVLRDKPQQDDQDQTKQAWMALDARLAQIMEYLQKSMDTSSTAATHTSSPEHYEICRQVQGLLVQANLLRTRVMNDSSNNKDMMMLPQQVAVLAKTVDAIAWYTDKFRLVHEVKGTGAAAASLREARRF